MPHQEMTFLGWLTYEHDLYPFRLTKDGKIDFGAGLEESEKWGLTNIRDRKIVLGEYANFQLDETDYTYKISKIDDLTSL
jgi:hypothetical protein